MNDELSNHSNSTTFRRFWPPCATARSTPKVSRAWSGCLRPIRRRGGGTSPIWICTGTCVGTTITKRRPTISNPQLTIDLPSPLPSFWICPRRSHSSPFTLHSPVGNFLFSYAMSAVMLGLVLLVGWGWRISHVGRRLQSPNSSGGGRYRRQESPPTIAAPVVGRITGLADCRWKQWVVDSGQWVEEGSGFRGQGSGIPNPQSLIPNPSFAVPAPNTPFPRASWKSPTTRGPRSSCKALARTKSNRPAADSSRWAN